MGASKAKSFSTVDEYLAAQPEPARAILAQVRQAIRAALPDAQECISYNMPTYKIFGRAVVYFAGWKKHFSVYPASAGMQQAFESRLRECEVEKGTIRFPLSDPAPVELISELAVYRAKEAFRSE